MYEGYAREVNLAADQVAVLVVVAVQLLHRVAEQTADLVLGLVLSHQRGLLLARACQNRTHSRRYFCKTCSRCGLVHARLFRTRVTQLAKRARAAVWFTLGSFVLGLHNLPVYTLPVFLFVRKYTSLCSHTFLLILSMSAIGLISAIVVKVWFNG